MATFLGPGVTIPAAGSPNANDPSKQGGWWLAKDGRGTIYVRQQQGPVIPFVGTGYYIGQTGDAQSSVWFGPKLHEALTALGASAKQTPAVIQFFDAGGFLQGQTSIAIQRSGRSTGKPSTSEAQYSPIIPEGPFKGPLDAIGSVLDFLKLIAWLFHPKNILRAVEFLSGVVLVIFGLWAALQHRGEQAEGFMTSESPLTRSGLGRVARELARTVPKGESPGRPRSAPHTTRRRALAQRYAREERLDRRR